MNVNTFKKMKKYKEGKKGKDTHSYGVPFQLEDKVLILTARVMIHICRQ